MADDAANPDPTPAPGLNPAAAASSEDDAPKQMRTCYMCAERFDVTGFAEKHAAKCRKLWLQERGLPEVVCLQEAGDLEQRTRRTSCSCSSTARRYGQRGR